MTVRKPFLYFVCLSVLFLMTLPLGNNSQAEQILIKAAGSLPANHKLNKYVYEPYMQEIEKRTNGKVKFKFYPAGILVKSRQSREAVVNGIVDIVFPMSVWAFEAQYPVTRIVGFPFIVESALHGAMTLSRMYDEIPEVREEFSNVKVLGFSCTGSANLALVGDRVPTTLDEIKGLNVWAGSQKSIDVAKLLGMNPRRIKIGDLYMSLQRGAVDGAMFAMAPAKSYKLVEVVNNWMVMDAYVSVQPSAMNLKKWNSLPEDVQQVFEDMKDGFTVLTGLAVDNESAGVAKDLEARGDNFYYLSSQQRNKARNITQPMFDEWVKEMNDAGMDGKAILEKVEELAKETDRRPLFPDISWGIVEK